MNPLALKAHLSKTTSHALQTAMKPFTVHKQFTVDDFLYISTVQAACLAQETLSLSLFSVDLILRGGHLQLKSL